MKEEEFGVKHWAVCNTPKSQLQTSNLLAKKLVP